MSTPKTASDFGEPWSDSEFSGMADCQDRNGTPIVCDFHFVHDEHRARIVSCVNACAGMSDPAAEIQALRDAVKEARELLASLEYEGNEKGTRCISCGSHCSEPHKEGCNMLSTLSKLRSIL